MFISHHNNSWQNHNIIQVINNLETCIIEYLGKCKS